MISAMRFRPVQSGMLADYPSEQADSKVTPRLANAGEKNARAEAGIIRKRSVLQSGCLFCIESLFFPG